LSGDALIRYCAARSDVPIGDFRARDSGGIRAGHLFALKGRLLFGMRTHRLAALSLLIASLPACGARARVVATNPGLALAPTCSNAVPVFADSEHVPYDYYEVALITAEGNSVYNGNGDLLKSIRTQAARLGANGVVIDALGATHATVKVVGAALGGSDADRKGRAIAIWMPSDTARVREACGGRSQ
jgi:hypothetical protein